MKKALILVSFLFSGELYSQSITDVNGVSINYKKIGSYYWTAPIKSTSLWGTGNPLTKINSAPMPEKDLGGGYYTDANDKQKYNGRYYINYENQHYYTWNTANNLTALKGAPERKYEKITNENTQESNSSLCPCGWRIPSLDEVSDLLTTSRIFQSKEEFKTWLFDKGLFDLKFYSSPTDAYAIKKDIENAKIEKSLLYESDYYGIYGMEDSDPLKPALKGKMFGFWLSHIGPSGSIDMQQDGLGIYVAKNDNSKSSLVIMPFLSTQMMNVKCVTDENGLKLYKQWEEKNKATVNSTKLIIQKIDSLNRLDKHIDSYYLFEEAFKSKKISAGFIDKTYSDWLNKFSENMQKLINEKNIEKLTSNLAFFEKKELAIDKQNEKKKMEEWKLSISNLEIDASFDKIKSLPLTSVEQNFVGNWEFVSNRIRLANGTIIVIIENFSLREDRTYDYVVKIKDYINNKYLNEQRENGIWQLEGLTLNYITLNQDGKPFKSKGNLLFDSIEETKSLRTFKDPSINEIIEMKGKKKKK